MTVWENKSFHRCCLNACLRSRLFLSFPIRVTAPVHETKQNRRLVWATSTRTETLPLERTLPGVSWRKWVVSGSNGFRVPPSAVKALNVHLATTAVDHSHLRFSDCLLLGVVDTANSSCSGGPNGPTIRMIHHILVIARHLGLLVFGVPDVLGATKTFTAQTPPPATLGMDDMLGAVPTTDQLRPCYCYCAGA